MGGNFKFQVQDSDLEYFFWRFGDLKNESHFLKKPRTLRMTTTLRKASAIEILTFNPITKLLNCAVIG
jgi:hypothetical protein